MSSVPSPRHRRLSEKFVARLMRHGKRHTALRVYGVALDHLQRRVGAAVPVLAVVARAVAHTMPQLEVRRVRVAGSTYQVPAVVAKGKGEALAIAWILEAARRRHRGHPGPFGRALALALWEASRRVGEACGRRNELHRVAAANRAYGRYRWW
jgi:small subunit ribosomal protein S7